MTGIHKLTLASLQKKFTAGEVTARDIVQAYTLRINQVEPKVKAYITQTKDTAMTQADARSSGLLSISARLRKAAATAAFGSLPIPIIALAISVSPL